MRYSYSKMLDERVCDVLTKINKLNKRYMTASIFGHSYLETKYWKWYYKYEMFECSFYNSGTTYPHLMVTSIDTYKKVTPTSDSHVYDIEAEKEITKLIDENLDGLYFKEFQTILDANVIITNELRLAVIRHCPESKPEFEL